MNAFRPIHRSLWRRIARLLCVLVVVPYLVVALLVTIFQRSLIYQPARDSSLNRMPALMSGANAEAIGFKTSGNLELHGWYLSSERSAGEHGRDSGWPTKKPALLYFCGKSGNRARRISEFAILTKLGTDVICFDYRGYGDNAGTPGEEVIAADARAIWEFLTTVRGLDSRQIIVYGESLGGGVATRVAAELSTARSPPAGLILRSTFSRLTDAAAKQYPWLPVHWLMVDRYPSVERIGQVTCPILMIHGRRDTVVPLSLAQMLFDAAPKQTADGMHKQLVVLPDGDHDNVLECNGAASQQAIREFVEQIAARQSSIARSVRFARQQR